MTKLKRGQKSGYSVRFELGLWLIRCKSREDVIPFRLEKSARSVARELKQGIRKWSDYGSFVP